MQYLEQVHDGHRGVGESVDEDGLQQALGVVPHPGEGEVRIALKLTE